MTTSTGTKTRRDSAESAAPRRRPAWRQRLVEAERGAALGFRGDSTLFAHFFSGSVILATAVVLGVSLLEWAVIVLALTLVLAAELFHKVLAALSQALEERPPAAVTDALRIATAAVLVAILGAVATVGLVFSRHVWRLFFA